MQLNLFTDYALRVLVHTAARPDRRGTSAQVAEDFGISRHHVVKVVNELQHLGYLQTVRGRTGGFTLARPPEDIRLGEVVRQTEGGFRLVECFEPATSTNVTAISVNSTSRLSTTSNNTPRRRLCRRRER